MKKVSGYIYVRALGEYEFEFFVDDNTTDAEIREKVDEVCDYSIGYIIEEGYEAHTEVVYRKKN